MMELHHEGHCMWLRDGPNSHGGINRQDPDTFSSKHIDFMLVNHPRKTELVLHLGLGAGEIPRFLGRYPNLKQTAVEISEEVIGFANHFNLPTNLMVLKEDARDFVQHCGSYDVVYCDIGCGLEGAPDDVEFFRNIKSLTPKLLVINVYGPHADKVLQNIDRVFKKLHLHHTGPNSIAVIRDDL